MPWDENALIPEVGSCQLLSEPPDPYPTKLPARYVKSRYGTNRFVRESSVLIISSRSFKILDLLQSGDPTPPRLGIVAVATAAKTS